jgi:hypothetical protein
MRSRLHHLPLFHPKTIRRRLEVHEWPADFAERHKRILGWPQALGSKLLREKERPRS